MFLNLIVVALWCVAADELAQEACHEELRAQYHHGECDIEVWAAGHEGVGDAFRDAVEFGAAYYHYGYEAKEEHQGADEAEDVHGLESEAVQEPEREQVKVAIDKTVEAHELRLAELACLMVNALLADACEACILGQIRDVAVHLAIDFKSLVGIVFESGSPLLRFILYPLTRSYPSCVIMR